MVGNGIRGLVYSLLVFSQSVFAETLDSQRINFHQAEQALSDGKLSDVKQRMTALKSYPLYPYLKYELIQHALAQESLADVKQFIDEYSSLPLASSLKNIFINELASRQDWQGILALSSNKPTSLINQCHWLHAKLQTGAEEQAWQGADKIWLTGKNLPAACDPVIEQWRADGWLTANHQLQRIILAFKAGNFALVKSLLAGLPSDYITIKQQLSLLLNNPRNLAEFASMTTPTAFSRQITLHGFRQLVRLDAQQARELIPLIVRNQRISPSEQQMLNEWVVWQWMGKTLAVERQQWRDAVIMQSRSGPLIERRIRLALSENDRPAVKFWLARLPIEAKQKQEWRYWQAALLDEEGDATQAKERLTSLARERGFYPMVAAQRLNIHSIIEPNRVLTNHVDIPYQAALQRVKELKYWQRNREARSEWLRLIGLLTAEQKLTIVDFALDKHWWDLAILATIKAKMWGKISKRFPVAYPLLYQKYAQGKLISPSYAMAIARQESGLDPEIQSAAGAIGLMQLMPATAKHTAKKFAISDYRNVKQLREPAINIQLGMQYLDFLYQKFNQNRILAAAAYNAGPSRVQSWLQQSQGQRDALTFIETIPFNETRNYVKYVLTYDGYYQFLLGHPQPLLTNNEWNRKY